METQVLKENLYAKLGALLEYPIEDNWDLLMILVNDIRPISIAAADSLNGFYSKLKRMDLAMRQEYYVQTFDLMPKCSLYLSIYLFGEESFKRSELMVGLRNAYEKKGDFAETELPDHLAVVLRKRACFSDEEWDELVKMCVLPALTHMINNLEKNNNPYLYILKAIQNLLIKTESPHG